MDGIQAVQQLCNDTPLPVVFVSGFNEQARLAAMTGCVLEYLTKPVGEAQLKEALQHVLQRFRTLQDAERE
jgi:CheY-like chemotaxis protein